ncbi:MAG: hypothetical protein ACR2G2_08060 [Pseudonocardia sp.]
MRNNASRPSVGHVIMFAAVTAGWLALFLITLTIGTPGAVYWIKVAFSGAFLIASAVITVLLGRRVARQKDAGKDHTAG